MGRLKSQVIAAGFGAFRASGLHRLAARWTRGAGAILMFHRVRPWVERAFAPNRLLEITPEFLDVVILRLRAQGFDIVTLDEALLRLRANAGGNPFAVLTFDDGYRDMVDHALPVLERRAAPFTLYATTGYADGSGRLWWEEMEAAIARLDAVDLPLDDGARLSLPARDAREKAIAFETVYWRLRPGPEEKLLAAVAELARQAGLDGAALTRAACLDYDELAALAAHPLCAIGAHSLTHAMLAKHDAATARREIEQSRAILERRLGREIRHFAYPVGDPGSAGARDFAICRELGFASAVTTRPGMIFPGHRDHLLALPRLSVNGNWQEEAFIDVLLSGAPFALWNRGRRLNVA
jgi:peptidoglycan/xylan/chitin deacetylase (PgdA/CDA1 family)